MHISSWAILLVCNPKKQETKIMKTQLSSIGFLLIFSISLLISGCEVKNQSEEKRIKIEKFVNYWNTENIEGIGDILCEDFELLESPKFTPHPGIEYFKQTVLAYHQAYPDFKLVLNDQVFDKDKCAGIWTITATNTGPSNNGGQPSGKHVEVIGISVVHFKDGKIKDEWISGNDLDWYQQLGFDLTPPSMKE